MGAPEGAADRLVPGFTRRRSTFPTEVVPTAPEVVAQDGTGGSRRESAGRQHFDVVIIGGGPGGYATALYGAAAGLSVAIVELDKVGGTCLHRGCVPAKEFLETASVYRTVSRLGRVRDHPRAHGRSDDPASTSR